MRLPWKRGDKPIGPACLVSHKHAELETAKEILAEIFRLCPGEVEEMIRNRIEERSWAIERTHLVEDGLWPAAFCLGGVAMGRSFESVRRGVKEVSERWLKASRALKKEDQIYGQISAEKAKKHSSEAFYALDDPLEAAMLSVLVKLMRERADPNRSKN